MVLNRIFKSNFTFHFIDIFLFIEIKSQPSSEVEYTFNIQEKTVPKSSKDKIFKLSTSKSKSKREFTKKVVLIGLLIYLVYLFKVLT